MGLWEIEIIMQTHRCESIEIAWKKGNKDSDSHAKSLLWEKSFNHAIIFIKLLTSFTISYRCEDWQHNFPCASIWLHRNHNTVQHTGKSLATLSCGSRKNRRCWREPCPRRLKTYSMWPPLLRPTVHRMILFEILTILPHDYAFEIPFIIPCRLSMCIGT